VSPSIDEPLTDRRDGLDSAAYHQRVLPGPALLAVAIALGLLVLLPARRLQLAGLASRSIGLYALVLWGLAFFLAVRPVAARFMVPILLVAYLAPFVVAPGRMARIVARGRGENGRGGRPGRGGGPGDPAKPPMRNVTPPDPPAEPAEPAAAGGSTGPIGPT
jgi:hypothetical protein